MKKPHLFMCDGFWLVIAEDATLPPGAIGKTFTHLKHARDYAKQIWESRSK